MKYMVTLNGKNYEVEVEESNAEILNVTTANTVVAAPVAVATAPVPAAAPAPVAATAVAGTEVLSPMPGSILSVNVTVGQSVKAGEALVVLEAMKMENDIVAPKDGVVLQLLTAKGSTVNTDDILVVLG